MQIQRITHTENKTWYVETSEGPYGFNEWFQVVAFMEDQGHEPDFTLEATAPAHSFRLDPPVRYHLFCQACDADWESEDKFMLLCPDCTSESQYS